MKKMMMFLAGALIAGWFVGAQAEASDRFNYRVSCAIPAIPGVNVPFVEETTITASEASNPTSAALVREETAAETQGILVRTLYEK